MKNLTETEVESIVNGRSLFWDGWTLVHRVRDDAGWMKKKGATSNGNWYVDNRYPVQDDGTWKLPSKLAGRVSR